MPDCREVNRPVISFGRYSRVRDFLTKIFSVYSQWNRGTKYLRVLILGLLGHAAFYEDETRYGVCPYADLRGILVLSCALR